MNERLHKLLAQHGLGSRRQVETWIREGRVLVNGQPAEVGQSVGPRDRVVVELEVVRERVAGSRDGGASVECPPREGGRDRDRVDARKAEHRAPLARSAGKEDDGHGDGLAGLQHGWQAVDAEGPAGVVEWDDRFRGPSRIDVVRQLGDFVIAKSDGTAAYQLAVVVDDAAAGVTEVVRGDDLVDSTPRQVLLYRALGLADRVPNYYHLPLVVGADGRRLAKRHGDTRLGFYRERGVAPGRVLMSDQVGPRTQEALDKAGISVRLVAYDKVYLGGGGIHCSTSPLVRDPV